MRVGPGQCAIRGSAIRPDPARSEPVWPRAFAKCLQRGARNRVPGVANHEGRTASRLRRSLTARNHGRINDIARPSVASLHLVTRTNGTNVDQATGFLVERNQVVYLVTNYHVLAARDPSSGANLHDSAARPDEVVIRQNVAGKLGEWRDEREPVRDASGPLWLVHPVHQTRVDVVALKLTNIAGCDVHGHALDGGPDVLLSVAMPVSIVGFPFGRSAGGSLAIWVQGTIASEPDVNFDDLPCFLIDSRTRPGQSGSPVIFWSAGGTVAMSDGGVTIFGGAVEQLLGVYSGRIHKDSDLGTVWRREVVAEIIDGAVRGTD